VLGFPCLMITKIALTILALAFTSGPTPPDRSSGIECAGQGDSLAPENIRKKLRGVVGGLARLGLAEEVAFLRERLVELGDTPSDHAQLERAWNRDLGRAGPEKNDRARKALTKNVTKQVTALGKHLDTLEAARAGDLVRRARSLEVEVAHAESNVVRGASVSATNRS